MTGQHSFAELLQILGAVASKDICHFDHGDQSRLMSLLIFVWTYTLLPWDRCKIDKCRANTLVTQQRLNYAQMDTGLQKMSGARMPQRVAVYVLAYMRLPEGCREAALHTAFGNG